MTKLKTILIDDDLKGLELLKYYLTEFCPEIEIIGAAGSYEESLRLVKSAEPELIFLDIMLNNKTGFDLLETILPINSHIIFMSGHDRFALKAFRYNPLDYLLKPLDIDQLIGAVQRVLDLKAIEQKGKYEGVLAVNLGNELRVISVYDIIYCEGDNNNTLFYLTNSEKLFTVKTLGWYENRLTHSFFIRIHKKYIINLNQLRSVKKSDGFYCNMSCGTNLSVSRRKQEVLQRSISAK
jgi:two-component system LytT family response regulator